MSIRDQIFKNGYVFLEAYRPDEDELSIAQSLGSVLALSDGPALHSLTPSSKTGSTPNTYSGIYGFERFPFHTDLAHWRLPPRYLVLRCEIGFKEVPTMLADGNHLADVSGRSALKRALVQPRRPINGKVPLLRLYETCQGSELLRWDEVFFKPASKAGEIGVAKFRDAIENNTPTLVCLAARGDTLIIDNWRMLHARAPIPNGCESRLLRRAYLGDVN
jgi:L-asparagine oxygenase